MALYDRKCPGCGEIVPQRKVAPWQPNGFPCPACGRQLRTARVPARLTVPVTLATSIGLSFSLGLKGLTAIAVSTLAALPVYFVVYTVLGLLFPPALELFPLKDNQRAH